MKKYLKSYGIAFINSCYILYLLSLPVLRLDFTSLFTMLIIFFILAGILDMMLDRGEKNIKDSKNNFYIAIAFNSYYNCSSIYNIITNISCKSI